VKRTPLERKSALESRGGLSRREFTRKKVTDAGGTFSEGRYREQKTRKQRPSEAGFHREVMDAYGRRCAVCLDGGWVQSAHIVGKGQGGPTVVENGLPLCQADHTAYDQYKLRLRFEHLTPTHRRWLAEVGYVDWDAGGQPFGRGHRRFEPLSSAQAARERERKQHDGGHRD
jgi:hypothetical protein